MIVGEFDRMCRRQKMKVDPGKSKVIFIERARDQIVDFVKTPSQVRGYFWIQDMVGESECGGSE